MPKYLAGINVNKPIAIAVVQIIDFVVLLIIVLSPIYIPIIKRIIAERVWLFK